MTLSRADKDFGVCYCEREDKGLIDYGEMKKRHSSNIVGSRQFSRFRNGRKD